MAERRDRYVRRSQPLLRTPAARTHRHGLSLGNFGQRLRCVSPTARVAADGEPDRAVRRLPYTAAGAPQESAASGPVRQGRRSRCVARRRRARVDENRRHQGLQPPVCLLRRQPAGVRGRSDARGGFRRGLEADTGGSRRPPDRSQRTRGNDYPSGLVENGPCRDRKWCVSDDAFELCKAVRCG